MKQSQIQEKICFAGMQQENLLEAFLYFRSFLKENLIQVNESVEKDM